MDKSNNGSVATLGRSIGLQAKDYKTGDVLKFVVKGYGEFQPYHEDSFLHPTDRLIEVEVKSVKMVQKQEFVDANQE